MKNFRIVREPRNWILQELKPGGKNPKTGLKGDPHWADVGYYGKLEDLAQACLNMAVLPKGDTLREQIPALIQAIHSAEKSLADTLKGQFVDIISKK